MDSTRRSKESSQIFIGENPIGLTERERERERCLLRGNRNAESGIQQGVTKNRKAWDIRGLKTFAHQMQGWCLPGRVNSINKT